MKTPNFPETVAMAYLHTQRKSVSTGQVGEVVRLGNVQAAFLDDVTGIMKLENGDEQAFPLSDLGDP